MSTDEEYLDKLLKSMEDNSTQQGPDLSSFLKKGNDSEEKKVFSDIEPENELKKENDIPEDEKWKESLDELLVSADNEEMLSAQDEEVEADKLNTSFDVNKSDSDLLAEMLDNLDVTQIIDDMDHTDDDLAQINDLLKKSDNNESIETSADEDVLELLESMKEDAGTNIKDEEEDAAKEKKRKGFSLPFGKKKLKRKEEDIQDTSAVKTESEEADKPKSFLRRLFEELVREEEEPQEEEKLDENGEILKELESEDKEKTEKKKNKKEKKKKEKKNKKSDNDSEKEGEEETKGKKEKKPKKEKKGKEKKGKEKQEGAQEKPVKVLSKKALFSLIAFCATIIAAVVLLSIFLTDYADKQNARKFFYTGNYQEVYELLYDKNLNQSDDLIFNRANLILKLQRRLDSYDLNKKTGKEAEALDALLQGVSKYEELSAGETYGAVEELQALYQQILNHLSEDYGISEEEAREINAYDSSLYSQRIYAIINGEDTAESSYEEEITEMPKNILPEEEDIIQIEQ